MKISVVVIGKSGRLLKHMLEHYVKLAGHYWKIDVRELSAGISGARGVSSKEIVKKESERILSTLPQDAEVIAFERKGKEMNSLSFSRYLQDAAVMSIPEIVFVIGGAYGLHQDVLTRANQTISLSRFTFTHGFARLILLEQLYRAGTIMRNEPYHKGALCDKNH